MSKKSICTVEGCAKPILAKGLCPMHYHRMRKHGMISLLCSVCGSAIIGAGRIYCVGCREGANKAAKREYQSRPDVAKKRTEAKKDYRRRNPDRERASKQAYRKTKRERAAKKIRDRIRSSMRRARIRGSKTEKFDPISVLERDKWICQLCGEKTLRSKRGTFHSRAPELDHIVPLSVGGEHSRKNTQCSCRGCNIRKGNSVRGQLRMLG